MVGLSRMYELSLYEFIYIGEILIHLLFSLFFGTHYSKSHDGDYLFMRLKIIPCFFSRNGIVYMVLETWI